MRLVYQKSKLNKAVKRHAIGGVIFIRPILLMCMPQNERIPIMKKFYRILFSLLTIFSVAGFMSCSDDKMAEEKPIEWNANGQGYISLTINLPTSQGGTRANDDFNDGLAEEYKVEDAWLMLFQGTSESEAKFAKAFKLNLQMNLENKNTQITTRATVTEQLDKGMGSSFYALVLLNAEGNGLITANGDDDISFCGRQLTTETKFVDIQKKDVLDKNFPYTTFKKKGFFMTNAPLTTAKSTIGTAPTKEQKHMTLVKIDPNRVYGSESEALSSTPSADIYVERNLAKVELENTNIAGTFTYDNTDAGKPKSVPYQIEAWALDNTNLKSYAFRHVDDDWNSYRSNANIAKTSEWGYRFVGNQQVETDPNAGTPHFRTYWAEDPNYNVNGVADEDFLRLSDAAKISESPKSILYCLENTFDVDHMNQTETTRVLFKVHYGDVGTKKNFYAYNNDTRTLSVEDDFKTLAKKHILALPSVQNWAAENVETPATLTDDNFDITLTTDEATGKTTLAATTKDITLKTGGTDIDLTTLNADLNAAMPNIVCFKEGIAYYSALIKHFGDEYTPWNGTGDSKEWTTQPSESEVYPSKGSGVQAGNYLGRYGLVRNNWYQLAVNKVLRIGSPVIPPIPSKPDDVIESYIGVRVNVLSWTVRKQDITLQ